MKSPHSSPGRLLELDVLRGLAAFGILCFHYTTRYTVDFSPADPALFQFPKGFYFFHFFFMISGFVIYMTLEKTQRPLDFIVSRFSRLFPCYWAAIILTFTAVSVFHLPKLGVSLKTALINLTMLQDWFGVHRVDGVYFTLSVELSFYLVMFLLFAAKKLKYIEIFGLGWLILMVFNNRLLGFTHHHMPGWIRATGLLTFGHLFVAGIFFYNLKTKGNTWFRHAGIALCLLVQHMLRFEIAGTIVGVAFFLIFYLFVMGKLSWIVNKPMVFLGTISYAGYLTHQNLGYIIIRYLYSIHANAFLRFIIPTLCSILIATALTYGLERPAMVYIRSKYKVWKESNRK
jgi:peptidoglycan/LPS O-acetylase OafA/YrhL